ncbi:MAG: hypothetical protein O3B87_02045 [bacterium]|nr:hypothetical protein [bacterium]
MSNLLAQPLLIQPAGIGTSSPVSILGPLVRITTIGDLITKLTVFLYPFASLILFFVLILGGYDILMSHGDPEKIKSGRLKMTAGIVGYVLLGLSYLISRILGYIFGVGGELL